MQNEETADTLFYIQDCINAFADDLQTVNFEETLQADVIAESDVGTFRRNTKQPSFLSGESEISAHFYRCVPFLLKWCVCLG